VIAWTGWGTALKPAWEPIIVARKPLEGTVAANVLAHGTGALNIDGCRVATTDCLNGGTFGGVFGNGKPTIDKPVGTGRWPANLIHDGSEEVLAGFPQTKSGYVAAGTIRNSENKIYGKGMSGAGKVATEFGSGGDEGSAARFFYCAKASKQDRDEGCEGLEPQINMRVNGPRESEEAKHATKRSNHHPTVKPTALMRYLCKLVTPPKCGGRMTRVERPGIILDPFMGSGSTGKAAVLEGFSFIGMDLSPEYVKIAEARIKAAIPQPTLL
jgi:site-specific DNA-methyltransferase (adenine-specific)